MLQRALRHLLELDCCRVDGLEIFVALVVDLSEAVVECEALLRQRNFYLGVITPPPANFRLQSLRSRFLLFGFALFGFLLGLVVCDFFKSYRDARQILLDDFKRFLF